MLAESMRDIPDEEISDVDENDEDLLVNGCVCKIKIIFDKVYVYFKWISLCILE